MSANKKLMQEGLFKRAQEWMLRVRYGHKMQDNIYAPTSALKMIQHIHLMVPDHCLIMADFDSFIYP